MIALQGRDIGSPKIPGSTTAAGSGYDLLAGGADIWETADQFHFAHRQVMGDFDWSVRVESLQKVHDYTKAGLMVRESLDADSRHFFHLVFPDNRLRNNNSGGYESQFRAQTARGCLALYPTTGTALPPEFPVDFPNVWLRLKREGNRFTAWAGSDGKAWKPYVTFCLDLPEAAYVGLALTAHDGSKSAAARFRDLQAN